MPISSAEHFQYFEKYLNHSYFKFPLLFLSVLPFFYFFSFVRTATMSHREPPLEDFAGRTIESDPILYSEAPWLDEKAV